MDGTADGLSTRYHSLAPDAADRLVRTAILDRVFAPATPPVVLLQAPAGHGKSTALAQIRDACVQRGMRCAWLNLDESDNDGRRHSTHLQRLLAPWTKATAGPAGEAAPEPRPRPATSSRLQTRSDWLLGQLDQLGEPVALFLDEFEVLTDRSVLTFWRELLFKLPAGVRVFIAARSAPEIGLARLTVSDRLLVLGAADLCFSRREVQQLFTDPVRPGSPTCDIDALYSGTEGWPAAIQLYRLALTRARPATTRPLPNQYCRRELADYLDDCVLSTLSSDTRQFLERTCILNRLNAQVCNRLAGRSDSQQRLRRLERRGLFVSALDEGGTDFRYHSLLASHLRDRLLDEEPVKFRALHREAAQWFFASHQYDDALHHAVTSGDLGMAADILEVWSEALVVNGEMTIAERWYDCLPLAQVQQRPVLRRRMAWALIFLRQRRKLMSLMGDPDPATWAPDPASGLPSLMGAMAAICADDMATAFELLGDSHDTAGQLDRFPAFEHAAAANLDAFRYLIRGEYRQAEVRLAAAQAYHRQARAFFTEGYTICLRGIVQVFKGQLDSALEALQAALVEQRQALELPFATAPLAACYVWALYERNELGKVLAVHAEYREMIAKCAIPDFLALAVLSVSRTFGALGQLEERHAVLVEAEALANENDWPRIVELLRHERGLHPSPAPRLRARQTRDTGRGSSLPLSEFANGPRIAAIRQAIAQRRYDEATHELSNLIDLHPGCAYLMTRLGLLRTQLLQGRGLGGPAARQFAQTLKLARQHGYTRVLLDEGEAVQRQLETFIASAGGDDDLRTFALGLVEPLPGGTASVAAPHASPGAVSRFSQREREIVDCLSQHLSNAEIARSMNISENTVKFHLKKIYGKLGVNSRADACKAANATWQALH